MKRTTDHDERRVLEHAVERQFRWRNLLERIEEEVQAARRAEEIKPRLGPYISISRQAGAGGGEIAAALGEKLGWQVLDKTIVESMAERFHMDPAMLALFDETKTNWIRETLGSLLDPHLVSQDAYVAHLGQMVMLAAYQGHVVFVGRGAQFFLPRERGLCVRIVAPEKDRVAHLRDQAQVSDKEARGLLSKIEQGRDQFIRRYFRHDTADPALYDLVVNSAIFGWEKSAEVILAAYRLRGLDRSTRATL
jgi:cytidylate kinase